ncbi:MAG: segregation/condensation protein A [Candidatus Sumerlaeia bacterium]|nr:segregation/condensation protein A [Candidatus Sumerlaeia bacterium]
MSEAPIPAVPGRIRLPVFEGPLDLLLHLVKINEMDVVDLQISEITRQYIEYLHAMAEMDLEVAGDFLVMAATLMNIKLRSILPAPPKENAAEDEAELDDILSTQDLVRRLVEYRRVKELAAALREREEAQAGIFYRGATVIPVAPAREELPQQDILALFDQFVKVLNQAKARPEHHVQEERFTVEEKVSAMREGLRRDRRLNLTRLFSTCVNKDEIVCYFLAILELAKMREITIAQAGSFEDILVEPWDEKVVYVG